MSAEKFVHLYPSIMSGSGIRAFGTTKLHTLGLPRACWGKSAWSSYEVSCAFVLQVLEMKGEMVLPEPFDSLLAHRT
jgi:hypothetical protein